VERPHIVAEPNVDKPCMISQSNVNNLKVVIAGDSGIGKVRIKLI